LLFSSLHQPVTAPGYLTNDSIHLIREEWNIGSGSYNGAIYNKDTFMVRLNDGVGIYDSKGLVGKIKINNLNDNRLLFINQQMIYVDAENYLNFYSAAGLQKRSP
jgi:hypothetical protein